jgi:hypothetical protein
MAVIAPSRLLIPLVTLFCLVCVSCAGSAERSNKMSEKILLDINSNGKKIETKFKSSSKQLAVLDIRGILINWMGIFSI